MESFCSSAEMNASDVILIDPFIVMFPEMESNALCKFREICPQHPTLFFMNCVV